jgi:hypothetical protein
VIALRRPGSGSTLASGVEVRAGDLADAASLARAVTDDVDAVVHLATPTGDEAVDTAALEALLVRLQGVAYRPALEQLVLAAAADGVVASVVRPGVVHGRGGGIPALLVELARRHAAGLHVGHDLVGWPMVHVDDLADLVVLALASPRAAGEVFHAVRRRAGPRPGGDVRTDPASAGLATGPQRSGVGPRARQLSPCHAHRGLTDRADRNGRAGAQPPRCSGTGAMSVSAKVTASSRDSRAPSAWSRS